MDTVVIRLAIAITALVVAAAINYHALAMSDLQRSKIRNTVVLFGAIGLLLIFLLPFLPLLTLLFYFNEGSVGASGMATLFNVVLVGAALCTVGSGASLVAKSIADRKREA